jgi:hypothetical protein
VENTRASYAGPRTCKVKDTFLDTDLGDPGVDGRIILKWIFKKWDGGMDWIELPQGQVAGSCEYGNEPSGSIKCGEFLDELRTSGLLKKASAPWSKLFS